MKLLTVHTIMALMASISVVKANINSTISTNTRRALKSASIDAADEFLIFADGATCRCEASWESLYNPSTQTKRERYFYNYETTKIRANGLVTVENVYVLSSDSPECLARGQQRPRGNNQMRPSTANNGMRSPYIFSKGNNRQLMTGEEGEGMDQQYGEVLVDATMNDLVKQENEQRDLQRYHSAGAGTTGSAPRTYGARNYGVRPYGATSYGYGKGKGKGKGAPPPPKPFNVCTDDLDSDGVPNCCFAGCDGKCATCDCICPIVPLNFPCPIAPTPAPTLSPSIAPECDVDVAITCVEESTGTDCDKIPPMKYLQCSCPPSQMSSSSSCATSYTFRYTGASCDSDFGSYYVLSCTDSRNFAMPKKALIIAKDMHGSEISRVKSVKMGKEATFFASGLDGCIPDFMDFEIRDEDNPNVILQAMTVKTRCAAGGIQLADSAGALEFAGYTCDGGKVKNCFTDILFEVCTRNVGAIPMQMSDMIFGFDGDTSSPLVGSPTVLSQGGEECLFATREITTCVPDEHVAEVDVDAMGSFGKNCVNTHKIKFYMEEPGTNPPTPRPTQEPTRRPTPMPVEPIKTRPPVPGRKRLPIPTAYIWTNAPVQQIVAKGKGKGKGKGGRGYYGRGRGW